MSRTTTARRMPRLGSGQRGRQKAVGRAAGGLARGARHAALLAACTLPWAAPALAVTEGESAPAFVLPSIHEGEPAISLAALRGKVVYLDFWASWCAPCLISLPQYNDMYQELRAEGLEVVAINIDKPAEDGRDFLLDHPLDFPIPSDPDGEIAALYDVEGMPTSVLIDRDGVVRWVHAGFRPGDMEVIRKAIEELLTADTAVE